MVSFWSIFGAGRCSRSNSRLIGRWNGLLAWFTVAAPRIYSPHLLQEWLLFRCWSLLFVLLLQHPTSASLYRLPELAGLLFWRWSLLLQWFTLQQLLEWVAGLGLLLQHPISASLHWLLEQAAIQTAPAQWLVPSNVTCIYSWTLVNFFHFALNPTQFLIPFYLYMFTPTENVTIFQNNNFYSNLN